jgi:putative phosphoesterase
MRVAALYDIHGNLPALEAVLDDVRRASVDQVLVGGDVLPGPMPRQCLELLLNLELPVQFVRGNGDRVVLGPMRGQEPTEVPEPFREDIRWNAAQLRPEHEQIVSSWPGTVALAIDGLGAVLCCHASPRNDTDIFTRATPEDRIAPFFAGVTAEVVICGHTHMQFDRTVGRIRVVNAGSVGMPYGDPAAYWLLLGPDIEFRRTNYDLTAAAAAVRQTAYPHADYFADKCILNPPSEAEIIAAFK